MGKDIVERVTTKKLVVMSDGVRANELSKVGSHCTPAGPSSRRYAALELQTPCHVQSINHPPPN
jgi:hypothetical protein